MNTKLYEEYVNIFKEKKIKLTALRLAVLECVATSKHFTINELVSDVENKMGSVNVMSIYNNVDLLLEMHLLFANTINGKQIIYEAVAPQLIHVKCHECGSFEHIESSSLTNDLFSQFSLIASSIDMKLDHFKLEMHGTCKNCSKN
ncbi:Fur family transcriptional regulator [Spiroplasma apis]|uniref:Fur family transcriptional regulator n=1 Tax=Spiroplasma apis B31 TaxID=1276258 RepID=V5RKS7_SPIAP|nr:transcriptional repressor [Spiroplasma apis]AHB36721.1 Fur family transcriptional regulator [Spiroplasma apis B31]